MSDYKRYEIDYYEHILDGEITQVAEVVENESGDWVKHATIEQLEKEISELKANSIPISKLEDLIAITDGFDNYAYSRNDLKQLIKGIKNE